jgi:cobyrinic acid a,c-diamide synthase
MTESRPIPRLILAAAMSGSGKTTITAGLIGALAARGVQVAPFKVGPDYIDPSYHTLAAGRTCHNLDAWMLPPERIGMLLERHARTADLALIEGVMGLFDGYSGHDDTGSTAHIARLTATPVVVVLDARAMARTAAALVLGMTDFEPRIEIAGVILNRVGSAKHAQMLRDAIEGYAGVPVLGSLGRDSELALPERHLGLIPTAEPGRWQAWLQHASAVVADGVDLERLLDVAGRVEAVPMPQSVPPALHPPAPDTTTEAPLIQRTTKQTTRIAVAHDAAFSFLYEDNLELLREAGAAILFFSPLQDSALPAGTAALYLCGGFPELYAAQLAENAALLHAIRTAAEESMPIYAECGGLMYLTEAVIDGEGNRSAMAGVLPGESRMTERLTLGYRTIQPVAESWLWQPDEPMRGHEFHYSHWSIEQAHTGHVQPAYEILPDVWQEERRPGGAQMGQVIASYVHLHFLAYPQLATRFVAAGT